MRYYPRSLTEPDLKQMPNPCFWSSVFRLYDVVTKAKVETTLLAFSSQTFRRLWPQKKALAGALQPEDLRSPQSRRRIVSICVVIFFLALGVRLFHWQDNRTLFPKLFTGMVEAHKSNSRLLLKGDVATFINGPAPPGDANILTYPPGYPIIMAVVFKAFGESDTAMRVFQIICDAAAAVLLFFIALEMLPVKIAAIAGTLAALSPQLAYYSLILLPDSLATLPILLAVYFIIRAKKSNNFRAAIAAGVFIGVSCWLRSNALMLAPVLASGLILIMQGGRRWRAAAALVAASILVIAPITIRNAVVFHRFIPLSLGVGQMLNVGITDYDKQRRFGLPGTDIETVTREAEAYNRPDYAGSLFGGNGIEREQQRTSRALAVVRSHPIWFAGVVLQRAAFMLRLERVSRVATAPGITSEIAAAGNAAPVWTRAPAELVGSSLQPQTRVSSSVDGEGLAVESDGAASKSPLLLMPVAVEHNTDYLLRVPIIVRQGSVVIEVTSGDHTQRFGSSPILSPLERITTSDQSFDVHQIGFVSRDADQISIRLNNGGSRAEKTVVEIGRLELFRLGPGSLLWTRPIRAFIFSAQRLFITAWILPLALSGLILVLIAGRREVAVFLLAVPVYYLCFQALLHTEYRYVLAAQSFLCVMVAVTLYVLGLIMRRAFDEVLVRLDHTARDRV